MFGAMVVFMSVQWTVASAAFKAALPAHSSYFHRTRKGQGTTTHTRFTAIPEAVIGGLLVIGSVIVCATNFYRFFETDLFAAILLIQSLPFLSAVALASLERFSEGRSVNMAAVRPAA
jgi:glucan 1,3-beta-glucosidase